MSTEAHAPTASEYIVHHLQHLQTVKQTSIIDFSVYNLDSIVVAAVLGALGCFAMWLAVRNATAGVPGRVQAAVEILFELVDNQATCKSRTPCRSRRRRRRRRRSPASRSSSARSRRSPAARTTRRPPRSSASEPKRRTQKLRASFRRSRTSSAPARDRPERSPRARGARPAFDRRLSHRRPHQ